MDPQTGMETLGESAKALTKLQEIILKIFGPHWTKRQADADAYADERKLQTIRDNPDMEIEYINGQINARERFKESLICRAEQRQLSEGIRQEINLERIVSDAMENLAKDDRVVSDEPVDEDWVNRFFEYAKGVSTEEMQRVWGKILAGEITQPGSFSLRTLDAIRNLTRVDAELFQKIAPYVLTCSGTLFITASESLLSKNSIAYCDILALDECGLINSDNMVRLNLQIDSDHPAGIYNKRQIIWINSNSESSLRMEIFPLTKVGGELINIIDCVPDCDYLSQLAKEIYNKIDSSAITVSVHSINYFTDSEVNYNGEPIVSFPN